MAQEVERSDARQRAPTVRVLAIDQGTSATKAVVFGEAGEIVTSVEAAVTPRAVATGGVEQDPEQLWDSVCEAGREAIARVAGGVGAVGFANQGETVLAWHRASGRPLSAAISWQDRRATSVCAELADDAEWLTRTTGLPLDPYFAAPKMTWLRRNVTTEGVVSTSDAWLVHRLTGAYVTDVTTASRTLLLDLERRTWSDEACAAFGLDAADLPGVVGTAEEIGSTDAFGPSLRLTGLSVDQQAALVGQHCLDPGESKCTYGTGAFLLANAGPRACHVHRRPGRLGGLATGRRRRVLHRRAGLRRRRGRRLAAALGFRPPRRGCRHGRELGARQRQHHRRPGPQRAGRSVVAARRPRQHRRHRPGQRARPRRPGHLGGRGRAGRRCWRVRRHSTWVAR